MDLGNAILLCSETVSSLAFKIIVKHEEMVSSKEIHILETLSKQRTQGTSLMGCEETQEWVSSNTHCSFLSIRSSGILSHECPTLLVIPVIRVKIA